MLGVFLDSETNGLNSQVHKIIEIAFKIINLKNAEIIDEYQSLIAISLSDWKKSNPQSLHINGLTWDTVKTGNSSQIAAQAIIDLFTKRKIKRSEAIFICQNPSFDRVFFSQIVDPDTQEIFNWPYHWFDLASMFWAISMDRAKQKKGPLPWDLRFSKDSIAEYYQLPQEEKPHRAMNGVNHLVLCYNAVVGFPFQFNV